MSRTILSCNAQVDFCRCLEWGKLKTIISTCHHFFWLKSQQADLSKSVATQKNCHVEAGKTGGNQHLENRKFHEDMNEGVCYAKFSWWSLTGWKIPGEYHPNRVQYFFCPLSWIEIPEGIRYHIILQMFPYVFTLSIEKKMCPSLFGLWRHLPVIGPWGLKSDGSAHEAKRWAAKVFPWKGKMLDYLVQLWNVSSFRWCLRCLRFWMSERFLCPTGT